MYQPPNKGKGNNLIISLYIGFFMTPMIVALLVENHIYIMLNVSDSSSTS